MTKLTKMMVAAVSLSLTTTACNANKASNQQQQQPEDISAERTQPTPVQGKTLVVYFSHTGENYNVGYIKKGNTSYVADFIEEATGADMFEIVANKDYNMSYKDLCDLSKIEQEKGELPSFKGEVKNIAQYDNVFIGGPIWWGTFPQVMFTFFKQYDLNGKNLYLFTTHEGSGLGNTKHDLQKAYPKAKIVDTFTVYGHNAKDCKDEVNKWLKSNGFDMKRNGE